jgi:Iron-containing redox enzyme
MEWLLNCSEKYRFQLRQGPFFKQLARAERPNDLQWVHQLVHQSREFTQALCLRYSLCHDKRYQKVFAEHAVEEADHPDQLIAWMREHGFLDGIEAGSVPPTQETTNCVSFCWRNALREPHDVQVVALNLLSEGVAFDFYSAVIPVLDKLNILSGRYWTIHTDVDSHHLTMGLDLCEQVAPDSQKGRLYQRVLWNCATLYHQMLSSWVGEQAGPMMNLDAAALAD